MAKISAYIQGHGLYEAPAQFVDRAIVEYLPATGKQLHDIVEERTGSEWLEPWDVSALLVVLASFYEDNPF